MFWGWWSLQKHLDLSPFSVASAFNAPLLREADPRQGANGIVKRLEDVRVRYGMVFGAADGTGPGRSGRETIREGRIGIGESHNIE